MLVIRMLGWIGGINVFDFMFEILIWWNECLDSFFWVNDIKDEKKVFVLLSFVGVKMYVLLSELIFFKLLIKNSYGYFIRFLKNIIY